MKKNIIVSLVVLCYSALYYYIALPPLNLSAPAFYSFVFNILIVTIISVNIANIKDISVNDLKQKRGEYVKLDSINFSKKLGFFNKISLICIASGFIIITLINLVFSPIFASNDYYSRIEISEGDFSADINEVDFSSLPLLDKDSSSKLGDRTMGEMSDWVSQFTVSNLYTQINYNDEILRVTPLEYDGIIKYFTNKNEGIKGYITVNSVDGESKLVTLESGMKYMESAYFSEDLYRTLRFEYVTKILGDAVFEIDEEGNPYWIVPTLMYTGIGLLEEVEGVIVLNAVTGESKYYELDAVPSWVDQVYTSDLIIEQIDDWGTYVNGFFNSVFTQKNVVNTTDGYNYLIIDDDVYLYTGITSVLSDESNLGFMLVNLRTKEAVYYPLSGAEEFSAMDSAEGLVQEKGYDASFPLLVNLGGRATYVLSLKDAAGLVKMYAFVDVVDYQIVSVTDSSYGIENAASEYLEKVGVEEYYGDEESRDITIKEILSATINGYTIYYFIDENDNKYQASITVDETLLPFLKIGDKITISCTISEIYQITSITK